MSVTSQAVQCCLRGIRYSVVASAALFFASAAYAQSIEELEEELEQQKMALQEAIADREATAFRAEEVESMLEESEEIKRQVEFEVRLLCEEKEALEPGSFDDCMSSSDN